MESLIEKVNEDIKTAMKAKEKEKLDALRYLKSMLLENKTSKEPRPEMDILIALSKKLTDSMAAFPEGHAIREKTANEVKFLSAYMPQPLSEEEVKKIIAGIVKNLPTPNMGAVMKELSPQIKGRFDGKAANDFVKEALQTVGS